MAFVTPVVEHWLEREIACWKRMAKYYIVCWPFVAGLLFVIIIIIISFSSSNSTQYYQKLA